VDSNSEVFSTTHSRSMRLSILFKNYQYFVLKLIVIVNLELEFLLLVLID
jgi:hypothetical protein